MLKFSKQIFGAGANNLGFWGLWKVFLAWIIGRGAQRCSGMIMKYSSVKSSAMAIAAAAVLTQAASADFYWSNVSMAGGGFVSAVIASPVDKGLFYARTDVGGAYRWDESTAKWYSMMDWVDVSERGLVGIEAIVVDPQE